MARRTSEKSIYELLESGADPRERGSGFPSIGASSAGDTGGTAGSRPLLAPGLRDVLVATGGSDLPALAYALRLLEHGELDAAERALSRLRFLDNVDVLMSHVDQSELALLALPAFDLLRQTRDYEVAKWTTLLTHVASAIIQGLDDEEVDRLTLLARHAELTPVVTVLLSIASDQRPDRLGCVIELAPHVTGWGLADLIARRHHYDELAGDEELDRLLLTSVARNADGLDLELAFPLAAAIGLEPVVERALADEDDIALREAVAWQLHTLIRYPAPHGGIDELPGGRATLVRWADRTALRAEVFQGERLALAVAARLVEGDSPVQAARWLDGAALDLDVPTLLLEATAEDELAMALVAELRPPAAIDAARELVRTGRLHAWVVQLVRCTDDAAMRRSFVRHALAASDGYLRDEAVTMVITDPSLLDDGAVQQALHQIALNDPAPALRAEAREALVTAGRAGILERLAWRRQTRRRGRGASGGSDDARGSGSGNDDTSPREG